MPLSKKQVFLLPITLTFFTTAVMADCPRAVNNKLSNLLQKLAGPEDACRFYEMTKAAMSKDFCKYCKVYYRRVDEIAAFVTQHPTCGSPLFKQQVGAVQIKGRSIMSRCKS